MSLAVERLAVRYGARVALEPSDLQLESGRLVGLVGPNGAGKSSLLRALAGVVPASGRVRWLDRDLAAMPRRDRARIVAYLPQTPEAHWPMSVRDLISLGRLPYRGVGQALGAADIEAIDWAMERTEVTRLAGRAFDTLSGGERARVLLARALAVRSPVLLVDEPVTSLDPYHQLEVMTLLADYAAGGRLVVAVLHDLTLAARYSDRVLLLADGAIVEDGSPAAVLTARTLEHRYRTTAYVAVHEGQPIVVPWRLSEGASPAPRAHDD